MVLYLVLYLYLFILVLFLCLSCVSVCAAYSLSLASEIHSNQAEICRLNWSLQNISHICLEIEKEKCLRYAVSYCPSVLWIAIHTFQNSSG